MSYSPLGIALAMILLSAYFSGMEIAFLSANRLELELERKKGHWMAKIIGILTSNPRQYIATMLVGNSITLVVLGLVMARFLEPLLSPFFSSPFYIFLVQTIITTSLVLITAEFLPKIIFMLIPNLTLRLFALPTLFFYYLFYPITLAANNLSYGILKLLHIPFSKEKNPYEFDKADLSHLLQQVQETSENEKKEDYEMKVLKNALDFSKVKLRNCMVPRTEIVGVDADSPVPEILNAFIQSGYSKIVAYKGNIDNIVGYFNSKDFFTHRNNGMAPRIISPVIVPETMSASKLLRILLQECKSLAVVVDEFGGTAGIVTTEDIIEEIFGEIEDEHDTEQYVEKQISENQFLFSARLSIEHINSRYHLSLPVSEEYETLAGFILYHLQRIPHPNETIIIAPFEIKIIKAGKNKIELVSLTRLAPPPA